MGTFTPRTCRRNTYLAPIKYSPEVAGGYEEARLCDYSSTGFGIEPIQRIEPGRHFYILTSNYAPGTYGPEAYKAYQVRIQWCAENDNREFPYRAGAQILYGYHDGFETPERLAKKQCDLCGRPTDRDKLFSSEERTVLCHHCHDHLTRIPDGLLKKSIRRFIAENVGVAHRANVSHGTNLNDARCASNQPFMTGALGKGR